MSDTTIGILLAFLAATEWSVGAIFARLAMQRIASTTTTFLSLVGGLFLVGTVAVIWKGDELLKLSPGILLIFVFLGFIQFMGGRFMNFTSVRLIGVGRATAVIGAAPLFSSILAVVVLGEKLTLALALGTLCVVGGIAVIATENRGNG